MSPPSLGSSAYSQKTQTWKPSSSSGNGPSSSSMSHATSSLASAEGGYGAYPSRAGRGVRSGSSSRSLRPKSPSRRAHTRSSSNASSTSAPPNAAILFPNFDLGNGTESFIAPLPSALVDTSSLKSPSSTYSGSSKIRIRPMHRKNSSSQGSGLDLSMSVAENEVRGAYTASDGYQRRPSAPTVSYADRHHHTHRRTSSSVSHNSTATDSSSRLLGSQYVHPMRQTPQAFTPPIARSLQASLAGSDDGDAISDSTLSPAVASPYHSHGAGVPYAPLPAAATRRKPSLHVRTASHSRSPSQTTAHQLSATPGSVRHLDVFSPDSAPQTARTSFDSMVPSAARKKSQTSLRQTAAAATYEDPYVYDQAARELSRELFAKQKAKDERLAAKEARIREREATRAQRKEISVVGRTRSKSVTTEKSVPYESTATPQSYEKSEHSVYSPAITNPEHLPRLYPDKRPGMKRATKAAGNQWSSTGFRLKTLWIRIMRALGMRPQS